MQSRFTRALALAAISAVTIAGLAACSPADSANTGSTTEPGKITDVTLQISGAAAPYYAPVYEAIEQGYFTKNGLNVTLAYAADSDIVQNTAAGNVQFGYPIGSSVITAKGNGVDINVVHTTYQQGIDALLFNTKTSGIKVPADLKGKTVAVPDLGSANYTDLQAMIKSAGLTLADVKVVTVGTGAIVPALQSGQVDAIMFSRLRYFALQTAGFPVGQILADKYLPSFGNVVVASPAYRKSHPAVVKGFTKALDKGIKYVIDNPAESVATSIAKYATTFAGQEAAITEVIKAIYVTQLWQSKDTDEHGLGYGSLTRWQDAIDGQLKYGIIKKSFKAKTLVVEPGDL